MRAALMKKINEPLNIQSVEDPKLGITDVPETEVLIRVEACGVCRSDWHQWKGDLGWIGMEHHENQILGHEPTGIIEEIGSQITQFEPGDAVVIPALIGDGSCYECRKGHANLCESRYNLLAPPLEGAWAEYVVVPHGDFNLTRLPEDVSMETMAGMGCRFMTAFHGLVHKSELTAGDWLAVHGCGGVGLSTIQIGDAIGANVIGVDIKDEKLSRAKELGALETVNGEKHDVVERIKEITGRGAHVSVDALGISKTCRDSIMSLAPRGRHIQIGVTTSEESGEVLLPTDMMVFQELEFHGSVVMPPSDYDEVFRLLSSGKIDPSELVSRTISLDEINDSLKRLSEFETMGMEVINQF